MSLSCNNVVFVIVVGVISSTFSVVLVTKVLPSSVLTLSLVCHLVLIIILSALSCLSDVMFASQRCTESAADVDVCCKDGLKEAEMCGDVEMQAEFLYCGAILCLISEKPIDRIVTILQVCIQQVIF